MTMEKMRTLEIAKAFGTNVKGLCEVMEYSRQAMNDIFNGKIDGRAKRGQ